MHLTTKKPFACIIVLLFTIVSAFAQDNWVNYKADDSVSLKFPKQPKALGLDILASSDKDSVAYIFTRVDIEQLNVDSADLVAAYRRPEIVARLKPIITKGFPGADVEDLKIGTWQGLNSYTTSGINTSTKAKVYVFMFLIVNKKLYILFVAVPPGVGTKGKDKFFSSVSLNN